MPTTPDDIGELIRDLTAVHSEQGFLIKSDVRERIEALILSRERALAAEVRAEIITEFKKADEQRWDDAEHCTCLAHAIHFIESHGGMDGSCDCDPLKGLIEPKV